MCYNTKQSRAAAQLEERFGAQIVNKEEGHLVTKTEFFGFDFPKTPVILNSEPKNIQLIAWGLIPHWSANDEIKKMTLNAKVETLDEKPSFKHNKQHRCLVLADGFYEWQWLDGKGKSKQKYTIELIDRSLFAFAGVWDEWLHPLTGKFLRTYTIVTTEAQGIMRGIHNSKLRMPIILSQEQEKSWLSGEDCMQFIDSKIELLASTENYQTSLIF